MCRYSLPSLHQYRHLQNWQDLGRYVQQLQQDGLHVVLIFDPAIDVTSEPFTRALEKASVF